MDIPSKYDPSIIEDKWYKYWMDNGFFYSKPDKRVPYTIVIPPPNVTGVLHMGHMLNNTIQDILIRRARMQGKNACWVPGTDHASIATEARVVAKLASEGIKKSDLTREEFLKHAWDWKEKHGGIILEQLKKLGASCDWNRTKFTMDNAMSESVIKVFVDLYKKGLIYRGVRMVNWDPNAKTAVSDDEVNYREVKSKLYFVKYKIVGEDDFVTVATTRPETILGDTGLCVHPEDERYRKLKGKKVVVPMINREIPVIFDSYVDPEFGTGALKVTPAHDLADYELGLKYHLEVIDIFNDDGTLNGKAQIFVGADRFKARQLVHKKLEEDGLLLKIQDYDNKLGFSERTDAVIEPRLSVQWFVKMKELSAPALENVMNDTINLYPPKFKNTYRHWMENVKDWCISRQLWWGQRIPAYYLPNNEYIVAETPEEALKEARIKLQQPNLQLNDLRQDEDVLDTWFSSWLWPISVFDGIRNPGNADIQYYYPTNDLVTAPEILFFWVARMIIAGYEYQKEKPFTNVYLTGIVRDKLHRKMSKSLGNSPDPLELMRTYSSDGVRIGMLLSSPAGNDLLFDEGLVEQGRNFCNKLWNVYRLINTFKTDTNLKFNNLCKTSINGFKARLNEAKIENDILFREYRISDALLNLYKLFWDDFASFYLELVKKSSRQQKINEILYQQTINFFEELLLLLHPFIPFITEEIWQKLRVRKDGASIMMIKPPLPSIMWHEKKVLQKYKNTIQSFSNARNALNDPNFSETKEFGYSLSNNYSGSTYMTATATMLGIKMKWAYDSGIYTDSSIIGKFELSHNDSSINNEDKLKILDRELNELSDKLKYFLGFLEMVNKKLKNEKFMKNANKDVIEKEIKKQNDTLEQISIIEKRIEIIKDQQKNKII